jgi:hypothetical protein
MLYVERVFVFPVYLVIDQPLEAKSTLRRSLEEALETTGLQETESFLFVYFCESFLNCSVHSRRVTFQESQELFICCCLSLYLSVGNTRRCFSSTILDHVYQTSCLWSSCRFFFFEVIEYKRRKKKRQTGDTSHGICMRRESRETESHFRVHDLSFSLDFSVFLLQPSSQVKGSPFLGKWLLDSVMCVSGLCPKEGSDLFRKRYSPKSHEK